MEQRDHLKKQIDHLGTILGQILADLLHSKTQAKQEIGTPLNIQTLKEKSGLDVESVLHLSPSAFILTLQDNSAFDNKNAELLADVLFVVAENKSEEQQKLLYEKSLAIYEYLEKNDVDYSLERHWKIERVKQIINV